MWQKLKRQWEQFKNDKPGCRCQNLYKRRHQHKEGGMSRFLFLGAGILLTALGIFLIPAPGPGALVTFLGLGLLGAEFHPLAKGLDWLEVRARAIADKAKAFWKKSTPARKSLVSASLLGVLLVCGFFTYRVLFM